MATEAALSREFTWLAWAVSPARTGEMPNADVVKGLDWPLLTRLAERHRVVPALAHVTALHALPVPSETRALLADRAKQAAFDELRHAAALGEILQACDAEGIDAAVLKGVPLSMMIHGRLGLSASRDIDLLVKPEQAWEMVRLLSGRLGFRIKAGEASIANPAEFRRLMRRQKDLELVNDRRRLIVELHWRLFDNPHLLPLSRWPAFETVTLPGGISCKVLPRSQNLVYLASHGAQHAWSRLKWLGDFAMLIALCDIEGRTRHYDETGWAEGRCALAEALLLGERLLGLEMPGNARKDATTDWRVRTLYRVARRSLTLGGERELEAMRFGSTAKNMSHYLLRASPHYWLTEALFDLTDLSALPADSFWRRWGALGRLGGWIGGRQRL